MNILLINNNPVVNKLVTFSAQKTSDNLEVVESLDSLEATTYDLVVIDDTLYSEELLSELNDKVTYSKSLYICSRDAEEVESFSKILKKPFLPTDLVELFSVLSQESNEEEINEEISLGEDLDSEDEIVELEELDELESEDDTLSLDDEDLGESVLDDDEAQKVKDLLEETDDELVLDDLEETEEELNLDDLVDENIEEDILEELPEELELEDETESEDVTTEESEEAQEVLEELEIESEEEEFLEEDEDLDIASQIESAVEELSEEDLESEIDEGTLLDIVAGDLDSLTSQDIKLAVGEEESELEEIAVEVDEALEEELTEDVEELVLGKEESEEEGKNEETVDGVEALKNLFTALSDKNVAASMKGMKISINITLGDS